MKCTRCNSTNRDNVKFCTNCGLSLGILCNKCKNIGFLSDIYCGFCGVYLENKKAENILLRTELPMPVDSTHMATPVKKKPSESERKNVTVLFADVSGFTAMSEKMDPEEVTTIMNGCLNLLADIVVKYEGHVDKFIGDCIMAIFGAPITHENDPELALRAALEMTKQIEEFNTTIPIKLEQPLMLHIGINTGLVIAGNVGSDSRMAYTVMGDTVNLASRLESISSRGQIYVSIYTYNLTRYLFDFKRLDPIKVKGKKNLVAVYQVLAPKPPSELNKKINLAQVPLVGRQKEIAILQSHTRRFIQGAAQVIFLVSDPGVGKSRVLMEIKQRLKPEALTIIEGNCNSYSQTISYSVFIDFFKTLFHIDTDDLTDAIQNKLTSEFPRFLNIDADSVPREGRSAIVFIGRLLGVDLSEEFDLDISNMDPELIKTNTIQAIVCFFIQMAANKPIILILENLQYIDSSSFKMLCFMLKELKKSAVMFLLLMRPLPEHLAIQLSTHARENYLNNFKELVFERLTDEEGIEFVKNYLETDHLPEAIWEFIRSRADGNPLYIESLVQNLINNETIRRTKSGTVELMDDLHKINIPQTIHGMILSRIDKLAPDAKDILQVASVIGTSFSYELLLRLSDMQILELNLYSLINAGLIFESRTYPEIEYTFCNVMIQEAVYSTMLLSRLKKLHHLVALQIEEIYKERIMDHYEILAHHYYKTDDFVKAFQYLTESGFKAKNLYANSEAAEYFTKALEVADKIKSPQDEFENILIALSETYELLGKMPEALEIWEKIHVHRHNPLKKADALRNMGRVQEKMGFKEKALNNYERAARLLSDFPEALETGLLYMNQSWVLNRLKQFNKATQLAEKALNIFETIGAKNETARTYNNLAVIHEHMGEFKKALKYNQRSLSIFLEMGNIKQAGNVYLSMGYLHNRIGGLQTAMEYYEKAIEIMERVGNRFGAATALMSKGRCYIDLDRFDEAELVLLQALRAHNALDLSQKIVVNKMALANVYCNMKKFDLAKTQLDQARKTAQQENFIAELGKVAHLEARMLRKQNQDPFGKINEAISWFKKAQRLNEVDAIRDEFAEQL